MAQAVRPKAHARAACIAGDQVGAAPSGDNRIVRKLLALLLLAILPLTPSWAGVAVDCGSGTVIAAAIQSAPAPEAAMTDGDGDSHPCCASATPSEKPCGADCATCHGAGITALGTPAIVTGIVPACPGETDHTGRFPASVPGGTFRPPIPAQR
jgi:hypothetical protein